MRKVYVLGVLTLFVFLVVACKGEMGVQVNIQSRPNPVPNVGYKTWYPEAVYESKVLKDPSDPHSELVEAVNIAWMYPKKDGESYIKTPVLKHLVTVIEHEEDIGNDFIEWMSRITYRTDGVVDNTQVLIHYYKNSPK